MYQSQTEIIAEMEIRSKICISNTREGSRIGGMLHLKNKTKPTNKKNASNFWAMFALQEQSN